MAMPYIDDDIVDLRRDDGATWQLYWGDEVEIVSQGASDTRIRVKGLSGPIVEGRVSKKAKFRNEALLRLSMIDVQQGDGLILETPGGKTIFIDGGDNQLFARHVAARFRGTTAAKPLVVDLMLVTHGDADHFSGLSWLRASETDARPGKSVFVAPKRYYHNGIVKRPGKKGGVARKETEMLGATTTVAGVPVITGLVDDPAAVAKAERNQPFEEWVQTLASWEPRVQAVTGAAIERRRIDHLATDAFDFLDDEDVRIEVLGPISEQTPNGPGLRSLTAPPDEARLMLGTVAVGGGGSWSASHTINGHSIAFRLSYGNVRFMFTGDLNQEAGARLREAIPGVSLRAEILKAPHHGSADFDMEFLKEVAPVVSLISSGDESVAKEYIHPRATLMSGLGKAARTTPGIIYCTELAAFFRAAGYVTDANGKKFFGFERTNFGIAHVRTDGTRVLAFTHSGKAGMNEAYRFTVDATGKVEFAAEAVKVSAPKKTP
jgi:hypothetical protein